MAFSTATTRLARPRTPHASVGCIEYRIGEHGDRFRWLRAARLLLADRGEHGSRRQIDDLVFGNERHSARSCAGRRLRNWQSAKWNVLQRSVGNDGKTLACDAICHRPKDQLTQMIGGARIFRTSPG